MVISKKMLERLRIALAREGHESSTEEGLTWQGYNIVRFVICKERKKYTEIEAKEK